MLRDAVDRIFGLQREIKDLRTKVEELSWDEPFGMWTRGAFLQFCRVMPRGTKTIAFIDLDDIHSLNERYGYSEVDRRVRATFSIPFRRSDLIARWFSGDEIVILLDCDRVGAEIKIAQLRESARRNGLTFTYEIGEWDVGRQSILEVMEELSIRNCRKRKISRLDNHHRGVRE
jgi:GGDEF domain-containing protein